MISHAESTDSIDKMDFHYALKPLGRSNAPPGWVPLVGGWFYRPKSPRLCALPPPPPPQGEGMGGPGATDTCWHGSLVALTGRDREVPLPGYQLQGRSLTTS
ncbi:uncharacterized protein BO72DRAFT_213841 [Aspergillus fijiensis CBS 313.89]|uniref:Uncharacterized protein n=1 Tax=Aspergillus fijiensis CBS 313.89 TaxID=1448319 RepID=A0A8G1RMP8_9EURO|nr:uncharacterized protein BO72DRAFT_213841 [Aspergillus fijiensis CBS 313.89]RAK74231.1 hypothetical protein BO72DRAFT_213841 [Aspergillus fijiensis CBS 313.89]